MQPSNTSLRNMLPSNMQSHRTALQYRVCYVVCYMLQGGRYRQVVHCEVLKIRKSKHQVVSKLMEIATIHLTKT